MDEGGEFKNCSRTRGAFATVLPLFMDFHMLFPIEIMTYYNVAETSRKIECNALAANEFRGKKSIFFPYVHEFHIDKEED